MPGNLQALRRRIRSVRSTRKITKAQELVAASRIGRAQERVEAARPYAQTITEVLAALAGRARIDHPLLVPRPSQQRAGVLVITRDRGLCGAYNANVIREAERLAVRLHGEGREAALYVVGRKGVTYFRFRGRPVAASWTGFSERPGVENAGQIGTTLIEAFLAGSAGATSGVDELYLVHTQLRSLMTQTPVVSRLAPVEIPTDQPSEGSGAYEFEPEAEQLLEALLPKYVATRIYAALVEGAASESASRRRAMKSATDNADELITAYTRQMNSARQAAITQEISEIVGGANALAATGSEV